MAELPTAPNGVPSGDYLHRSIDQLRSLGHLTTAQLVHDYKPFNISEFRQNVAERLDYSLKNGLQQQQQQQMVMEQQQHPDQQQQHLHHQQQQQQQLKTSYSAPNSPPTPHEQQEQKYDPSRSPARQQMSSASGSGSNGSSPEEESRRGDGEQAKPYKCASCNKSFANSSYLSQHTRIHLGIKPYRCEICQRKFTQLSHLQQHIRTHTGDKPYKCRHAGCPKAFSQLSNLQSHSRCHQTDKPFKCNSCYKCFGDEMTLLEHIPKHKDSKHLKTHICNLCGKSYTQETYLQKHLQKHAEKAEKQQHRNTAPVAAAAHQQHVPAGGIGLNLQRQAMNDANAAYWAKMGADSAAASLAEAIQQQLPQANGQPYGNFASLQQPHHIPATQELMQHHQRLADTPGHSHSPHEEATGEDLVLRQSTPQHHLQQQQQQAQQQQAQPGPGSSAFTPLTASVAHPPPPHLQQHRAPPAATAAYLYQQNAAAAAAAFPTQLISLHQIRNYAHQPGAAGLIAGDHLPLGLSAVNAAAKEKAQ
ncbi:hypothetical protein KR026_007413 [Drosophila bipectinata]|nr:hypothetical protein KR026_007413 [Drosophila bipectinata]